MIRFIPVGRYVACHTGGWYTLGDTHLDALREALKIHRFHAENHRIVAEMDKRREAAKKTA